MKQVIEAWQINNRINMYLLESITEDEHLKDMTASKGRNVGQQFAHIHNVRLMWYKEAAPKLLDKVSKIEKEDLLAKSILIDHLNASGLAMEALLKKGIRDEKIKGFKPHPIAFLGYIISHESHHRGQIVLSLKQSGHPVSKKVGFGLWQWGTR